VKFAQVFEVTEQSLMFCNKIRDIKVAQNSFLFFWSLLELDAIFQAWNGTVLNAYAIHLR